MKNTYGIALPFNESKKIFESFFKVKLLRNQNLIKCPFHEDSKASMSVNISKGVYFCHGCGKSGGTWNISKQPKGEN
jgi:hypothetical protein